MAKPKYKNPITTVGAILTRTHDSTEQVLLTRRDIEPFKGLWCLPGGHIDQFEHPVEAIIREVKEETGLEFRGQFFDWFLERFPERQIYNIVLIFTGKGKGEINLERAGGEVSEIAWFSIEDAISETLAFEHNKVLESYSKSQT